MDNVEIWLKDNLSCAKRTPPSSFGIRVAKVLDIAYAGLEELQKTILDKRTQWDSKYVVSVVIPGPIRSACPHVLTDIVILALDYNMELEVSGRSNWGHLVLTFRDRSMLGDALSIEKIAQSARKKLKAKYRS